MRLITLNTWCGRALYPLMKFFRDHADKADIFCLQEVRECPQAIADEHHPEQHICGPLHSKIAAELKDFDGVFARYDDKPERMSQSIFVRRGVEVLGFSDLVAYWPERPVETGNKVFSPRKLQYVRLKIDGRAVLIANMHGLWDAGPKTDTPTRLAQSRLIRGFMDSFDGPKILCGDFNLLPETESLAILARGMQNPVVERGVPSTRTVLYRHHDDPTEPNFADYVLASPEVVIEDFRVLPEIASDHSPLYLEFRV